MESVMLGMVLRPGYPARGLERWRVGAGSARLPGRPAEPSGGLRLPNVGIGIPPRDATRAGPKPRPCHLGVPSGSILHQCPGGLSCPPPVAHVMEFRMLLPCGSRWASADVHRAQRRIDLSGRDRPLLEDSGQEEGGLHPKAGAGDATQAGGECRGLTLVLLRLLHCAGELEAN